MSILINFRCVLYQYQPQLYICNESKNQIIRQGLRKCVPDLSGAVEIIWTLAIQSVGAEFVQTVEGRAAQGLVLLVCTRILYCLLGWKGRGKEIDGERNEIGKQPFSDIFLRVENQWRELCVREMRITVYKGFSVNQISNKFSDSLRKRNREPCFIYCITDICSISRAIYLPLFYKFN